MYTSRCAVLFTLILTACGGDEPELAPIVYGADDGDSCTTAADCAGDSCLQDFSGWPQGYCTTTDCLADGCTGEGAVCLAFDAVQSMCFQSCSTGQDCRTGYACEVVAGTRVCKTPSADGPSPGDPGSACESAEDCNSGQSCETALPGGYCTSRDCEACPGDSTCAQTPAGRLCAATCETTRDCRPGYVCDDEWGGNFCVPFDTPAPNVTFEETSAALGITCNAVQVGQDGDKYRWEIEYTVDATWTGYTLVPMVRTGRVDVGSVIGPEENIDLINDYIHHNLRAVDEPLDSYEPVGIYKTVSYDWPFMVPYSPARQNLVQAGNHTLRVTTDGDTPCLYVLPSNPQAARLDLNIHIFGIPGIDASNAQANADVQEVLDGVNTIFEKAGIQLGDVRFYDPDRESLERYQIVRGFPDLRKISALGQPRGPSLDEHLSVDVFWVEDILVGQTSGLILGLSAGVPGPPGMHGNANNGLIFRLADLGQDNAFVAQIMAHELGHYLGLRHTTETLHNGTDEASVFFKNMVDTQDPLDDTPVCSNVQFQGFGCPDAGNLMFPAVGGSTADIEISEQQAQVLRLNPFVK